MFDARAHLYIYDLPSGRSTGTQPTSQRSVLTTGKTNAPGVITTVVCYDRHESADRFGRKRREKALPFGRQHNNGENERTVCDRKTRVSDRAECSAFTPRRHLSFMSARSYDNHKNQPSSPMDCCSL